jgi:hypothetical protein
VSEHEDEVVRTRYLLGLVCCEEETVEGKFGMTVVGLGIGAVFDQVVEEVDYENYKLDSFMFYPGCKG